MTNRPSVHSRPTSKGLSPSPLAGSRGDQLPAGIRLGGQYRVQCQLGRGSYGITYLARDEKLDVDVAVKEYFPRDFGTRQPTDLTVGSVPTKGEKYSKGLEQFKNEARILGRLSAAGTPGIVRVMNAFDAFGTTYMVMEYVEGESLASILNLDHSDQPTANTKPLQSQRVLEVLRDLCNGLAHVHAKDIWHLDIKPSNIMLRSADGSPVLIDFGAAQKSGASDDVFLTPHYAPPEQYTVSTNRRGPWTDIYALGATAYVAVTGQLPPVSFDRMFDDTYEPLTQASTQRVNARFARAVDHALRPRHQQRPQSVPEWKRRFPGAGWGTREWLVAASLMVGTAALAHYFRPLPPPPPPVSSAPPCGASLRDAATNNDDGRLIDLFNAGCNPDIADANGETSLHRAAQADSVDAARVLLERGASVDQPDHDGETPLHRVAQHNSTGVATLLLDRGAEVDRTDEDGDTALYHAAQDDRVDVAIILLERNANPRFVNQRGERPLHRAAQRDSVDVASVLLEGGVNPQRQDENGWTALHHAAENDSNGVAGLLLDGNTNLDFENNRGQTPLHIAARHNSADVASTLLDGGANVNYRDDRLQTPLHVAAWYGAEDAATMLLNRGADVNALNNAGSTPLHYAAQRAEVTMAGILLANGAEIDVRNAQGRTALDVARQAGAVNLAEVLSERTVEADGLDR